MQSLETIDSQLKAFDAEIGRLVDLESLKNQLGYSSPAPVNIKQLGQLQNRDAEITRQIEQLQELWLITNLKKEIEINLELFEFETAFSLLDKLNQKIASMTSNTSVVQTKWMERYTTLREQAYEKFLGCWKRLVVTERRTDGSCSMTFNKEVEIDDYPVMYESLEEVVRQHTLPHNTLNMSHNIDSYFMTKLFAPNHSLRLTGTTLSCEQFTSQSPIANIESCIHSVKSLVEFVNIIPASTRIINYISPQLNEKLKEFVTEHADIIYVNDNLKVLILQLGDYMRKHNFTRIDLKNWITTELDTITIDHYLNAHIERIRELFINPDFTVIERHIKASEKTTPQSTQPTHLSAPKPQSSIMFKSGHSNLDTTNQVEDIEDDDGWDNWGDDDNVDEEDEQHEDNQDDEDGWGWGDDDEEEPKPKSKRLVSRLANRSKSPTPAASTPHSHSPPANTSLQTTKIADQVAAIIKSYIATSHHLPISYHQEHLSKVEYLTNAYYMLGTVSYASPLLQYNDMSYIQSIHPSALLAELSERLLLTFIKHHEESIQTHYTNLHGLDPSITAGQTMHEIAQIQDSFTKLFESLRLLDQSTSTKIAISVIGEFYQSVFDDVMHKNDIGEQESEYLANLIIKFLALQQPFGDQVKVYVKNWEKLNKTSFILNAHLKDIMELFEKGELFEFETEELVSLIDKLFAQSDRKTQCIRDIREIRAEMEQAGF